MRCQQAQEWMSERLDGVLEPARESGLEQHLHQCAACQQEWQELQTSWDLLGQLPELEPSPLFRAQVWEKLRQQPEPATVAWPWWRRCLGGLALGAAGLALCLNLYPKNVPSAGPSAPLAVVVPAVEVEEWDPSFEVLPSVDALAQDAPVVERLPLGDLSDNYFAFSDASLDPAQEEL